MLFFSSPLEQFQILPIVSIRLGIFDFSITNSSIILALGLSSFIYVLHSLLAKQGNFYVVPNRIQYILETIYSVVYGLLHDNVGPIGKSFFPYVFTLFNFILISNIIGLVPYSFTVTSHLIVTFALALMTFIGINLICIREHSINMLSLFFPPGSSIVLAFLLVPIEIVSYIFRPISLSVRLFANMMAGHTLLKVIAGFAWTMMLAGGGLFVAHVIPLAILVILMLLELGVATIQAYVFAILTCIYLNDAIHLH
jgi:ATP synthase subunit 6|mmetsp:Transcript_7486/g.12421  ORF Transcript_7486/g.12421 Transcript_7486/m.12421 type:complete len:254 (-) Transcript_7486:190-951(-)